MAHFVADASATDMRQDAILFMMNVATGNWLVSVNTTQLEE